MAISLKVESKGEANAGTITTTCPECGHQASLLQLGADIHIGNQFICGQRLCPNPKCKRHLFIASLRGELIFQYPPLRIPFEKENIPGQILETFEEALTCHSESCYVAAAIMVRRTLEEICEERGAPGGDLKERIKNLKTKIVLPHELLEAMDELRLLGNDAAHIEAKSYSQIGKEELETAIDLTKEILKALYQYSTLLSKIRALKK